MALDKHGQRVLTFETALRNASRLGTYADLVVGMYESGEWRQYTTALGPERWRAHEFDYFLISCDARYEDVVRILGWDTVRAAKLAETMTGEASAHRRSLAEASADWTSPTRRSLSELAQKNGWLIAARNAPTLKGPPVSQRARVRAREGVAKDEYTRRRRARQLADQRPSLDRVVEQILQRAKDDPQALRYIIDQLRRRLPSRGRPRGSTQQARWEADIAAMNGNHGKLADRWGVSQATVRQRLKRQRDK
jgi:hypothetical protein